jgi:multicomponent K+:H+ antiporter subunit F
MLNIALSIAFALIGAAALLTLWRLWIGPTLPDRILALDTLAVTAVAGIVLFGIQQDSTDYFETALMIALMGFVSTAALCKYLLRGDIIE